MQQKLTSSRVFPVHEACSEGPLLLFVLGLLRILFDFAASGSLGLIRSGRLENSRQAFAVRNANRSRNQKYGRARDLQTEPVPK